MSQAWATEGALSSLIHGYGPFLLLLITNFLDPLLSREHTGLSRKDLLD
jgi:hypothetical protein